MSAAPAIGIDVGGTGIKAGLVNLNKGHLVEEKIRVPTPKGAHPDDVLQLVKTLTESFDDGLSGRTVGIGFPSKIIQGKCATAVNISNDWLGMDLLKAFSSVLETNVAVANDADAAGLGELNFGSGNMQDHEKVLFLTLGTGIGSAIFNKGRLLENTELGLLKFKGGILEKYASNKTRKVKDLSWKKWGKRLNEVLHHLERTLSPDIIVLGGGVTKKFKKFEAYLDLTCPVRPASLKNNAGIVGAAWLGSTTKLKTG